MSKKINKLLVMLLIVPCLFIFTACKDKKPQVQSYQIAYELNGGVNNENNPTTYSSDVENLPLLDPTREFYDFDGWFADGEFSERITAIVSGSTGDKTFYAKWTPKQYSVSYELDGGTQADENVTSYNILSETITLKEPSKLGFDFDGWFVSSDFVEKVTQIESGSTGNKTFYAKWTPKQYSVSYELDGGTQADENVTSYNILSETITLKEPSKLGFIFDGWFESSDFGEKVTQIESGSTGNKTFYAKWTPKQYSVSYKLDGGVQADKNVTTYNILSGEIILLSPTKYGHKFIGWYSEETFENKITKIESGSTGDKVFYAKWNPESYDISFDYKGANSGNETLKISVTFGQKIGELPTPNKDNCLFLGWWLEGTEYTSETICNWEGNKMLVANWKENDKPDEKYSVTFNSNGGTSVQTITDIAFGTKIDEPENVTRNGYELEGWFYGGEIWNFTTKSVTENIVLEAKWKTKNYSITYVLDGGENDVENPVSYTVESKEINFKNAIKGGYSFRGWYTDENHTNQISKIEAGSTGNVTLYAYFEYINVNAFCMVYVDYKLPELISGMYENETKKVQQYSNFTLKQFPSNLSEYFLGYYYLDENEKEVKIETNVIEIVKTGELHIYAKWNEDSMNNFYSTSSLQYELDSTGTYAILTGYSGIDSTVIIPKYVNINGESYAVLEIKKNAFKGNKDVLNIVLNAENVVIGEFAFANSTLVNMNFNKVKSIGEYAFEYSLIKEAVFGANLTELSKNAFRNATKLETINFKNVSNDFIKINSYAFFNCESLKNVTLRYSISYIDSFVFENCVSLTSIDFLQDASNNLTLGMEVFKGCTGLTRVTVYLTIKTIGEKLFDGCKNLEYMELYNLFNPYGSTQFMNVFGDVGVKHIKLMGNNITEIGKSYFANLDELETFIMSDTVVSVGEYAFSGCVKLEGITFSQSLDVTKFVINSYQNTLWLASIDDVFALKGVLLYVPENEKLKTIVLSDNITIIAQEAFSNNQILESIEIPTSCTMIDYRAFYNCKNLKSVKFKEGSKLETIEKEAFNSCTGLQEIDISVCINLTYIGDGAFRKIGSKSSTVFEFTLPSSLTSIGQGIFEGVKVSKFVSNSSSYLAEDGGLYEINSSNEKIAIIYFPMNYSKNVYVMPSTITEIYKYSFENNTSLKYIFSSSDLYINKNAFSNHSIVFLKLSGSIRDKQSRRNPIFELSELAEEDYTFAENGETYDVTISENVTNGCYYVCKDSKYYIIYVNSYLEIEDVFDATEYASLFVK